MRAKNQKHSAAVALAHVAVRFSRHTRYTSKDLCRYIAKTAVASINSGKTVRCPPSNLAKRKTPLTRCKVVTMHSLMRNLD